MAKAKKKIIKKAPAGKTAARKFPRNYRRIPERLNSDEVVFFVGTIAILLATLILSLDLYSNIVEQKKLSGERTRVMSEVAFWQNEIKKYPDYRDGYFSLALLHYRLRDVEEARKNLNKALELDPNFEKGRELEKVLSSR
jgi:tetratricopeptide (TPR) repeat protein